MRRNTIDKLDDVRAPLMKIRAMASIQSHNRVSDREIADEFQHIVSLANLALRTLDGEFPRGDRPPIDAFLLDEEWSSSGFFLKHIRVFRRKLRTYFSQQPRA